MIKKTTYDESNLSVSSNTSSLTIHIYFSAQNQVTYFQSAWLSCSCYGQTQGAYVSHPIGGSVSISFTFDNILHDNTGNMTVGWSWACDTGTEVLGTVSESGTKQLTQIDRFAQIIDANNFTDEENPSFTYTNPAGLNNLNCWLEINPNSQHLAIRNITSSATSGTFTWDLTEEERNQLRSKTLDNYEATCRIGLYSTIGNTTQASYKDKKFKIVNSNPIFTDFEFEDINPTTLALTGNNKFNVRGYSNIKATIPFNKKAIAQKGASIKKYQFDIGNKSIDIPYIIKYVCDGTESGSYYFTYNYKNYQFTMPQVNVGDEIKFNALTLKLYLNENIITTTNNNTGILIEMIVDDVYGNIEDSSIGIYTIYAQDTRQISTPVTKTALLNLEYNPISFTSSSCKVERNNGGVGGNAILTLSGYIWNSPSGFGLVNNSIKSVIIEYKETTQDDTHWLTSPTIITPTINNSSFSFNDQIDSQSTSGIFDLKKSYNFRITIEDELSTATIDLTPMASAIPNISLSDNGVGIMCDYNETLGGELQIGGIRPTIIIAKELYDSGGSNGDITMSEDVRNYDYIEVYFYTNDNVYDSGKFKTYTTMKIGLQSQYPTGQGSVYFKSKVLTLTNNGLTFSVTDYAEVAEPGGAVTGNNVLYIYKIIGYKYI